MYKNKVQSLINKLHRSYRFTILHSPYLKSNCTTSTYLADYINVHKLNSADDCLRVLSKSTNSQRYTAVTGWLTRSNQHTRGATTLNVTRHPPHNIAVIQQQLYTEYCFAPHNELVEYTLNSLFDSHISRISSPILCQSHNALSFIYVV